MKKINKKKNMSTGKKVALGAGIAAAGAGAYYLFGPNAKMHQKKAAALMAKIKKEVGMKIKKAESATLPIYHKTVDGISSQYMKEYKLHEGDIKAFAKKLKSEWKDIPHAVKKAAKKQKAKTVKKSKKGKK